MVPTQPMPLQQRQWPRCNKQRISCVKRKQAMSLLFLSTIVTVGSSLYSIICEAFDNPAPEPLVLVVLEPRNDDGIDYPRPLYNLSQSDEFLKFWRASHTRNFTRVKFDRKDAAAETEMPIQGGDEKNARPPLKMLLGIITLAQSRERRTLIRQTYLNYYQDMAIMRNQNTTTNSHKLCSLRNLHPACQIAYVFVAAGGSLDSPMELMHPNASLPLTVPGPAENDDEDDILYLNVREHMNQGKIPTWFKYAVTMSHPEIDWEFDYVAKVDDDTLLFTGNLMKVLERNLLTPHLINPDGLVYGGTINHVFEVWKDRNCLTGIRWDDCPIYGPIWMIGPFYFLSRNLANYITSDVVNRTALTYVEDVSTASFVWSHPGNITVVEIPRTLSLMNYGFGSDRRHRLASNKYKKQIYGHSEDACWSFTEPYFKRAWNVRKTWREYLLWSKSGQTFNYRFQLHDFPPPRSSKTKGAATASGSDEEAVVVHHSDFIYAGDDFDASPIVVEDPYNMVFFPITGVADVAWRCLIRRLLGYADWDSVTRQLDGLTYLSNYSISQASDIMSSKNFTRVMFVRNPLHRIQSNYMKLVMDETNNHAMVRGCNCSRDCGDWNKKDGPCHLEKKSFANFLAFLVQKCDQPYWRPISRRMEPRYKKKLDFVGTYESISADADKLFRKLLNLGANQTIAEVLGWSESLKEHFEHFDDPYQPSDAPHLFEEYWSDIFARIYKFEVSWSYGKYNVTLPPPSGNSTKGRKTWMKQKGKK